jgi:4-amino-4-deoxy-L-arabinose transferase-like glycosyltransferase
MSVAEIPHAVARPAADIPAAAERSAHFALTIEHIAYFSLFALALLAHLWGLGDRALHHDETLHAMYSWRLYMNEGFLHDPLLHGPFLYHIVALGYFLFGDSDFTARLTVAVFGSVLVVLPFLIRRELGRGAALLAAVYLLISPAFLYIGRFERHDIYSVVFEMLAVAGVVRYASTRQARWLYLSMAALGLMAANMETFYLFAVILGALLALVFFWRVWRPGLLVGGILGLAIIALVFVLPGKPQGGVFGEDGIPRANGPYVCPTAGNPLPPDNPIVADPGPILGLPPLATADNNYALCVRNQYDDNLAIYFVKLGQFFGHPAILMAMAATVAGIVALYVLIWRRRGRDGTTAWARAESSGDGIVGAFASLATDWRVLTGLLVFLTPYTLLFTSFFGHPSGFVSGTTGSLLYWLSQHNVQRGEQPRYYYLMQMVVYEPLALFWGIIGLVILGVIVGRRLAARRAGIATQVSSLDWRLSMPALLAWWAITTLALYSWAGEKMPWLTIHVALPIVLLGAWALARTLRWWSTGAMFDPQFAVADVGPRMPTRAGARAPALISPLDTNSDGDGQAPEPPVLPRSWQWDAGLLIFLAAFGTIMAVFFVVASSVSKPDSPGVNYAAPFLLPIGVAMLILMTLFAGLVRNVRWAIGALALAIALGGSLYTMRNAYQLSYRNGDNARELLVFVQTSPDVMRVVRKLEQAATKRSGDLKIWYDNETVWQWYMRNFKDAEQQPPSLPVVGEDVSAVLLLSENYSNPQNQQNLQGFLIQRYPLRWWNPEQDIYRLPPGWASEPVTPESPLLMRMLRNPFDGRTSAQVWQYLLYRQLPAPLGSSDFVLAVRPELAAEIGLGTGEEQP